MRDDRSGWTISLSRFLEPAGACGGEELLKEIARLGGSDLGLKQFELFGELAARRHGVDDDLLDRVDVMFREPTTPGGRAEITVGSRHPGNEQEIDHLRLGAGKLGHFETALLNFIAPYQRQVRDA